MSLRDKESLKVLKRRLISFEKKFALRGVENEQRRQVFLRQIVESIHRVKYISAIKNRDISPNRANPKSNLFDPLKAAILENRQGRTDEAFWLVFLFIHFGKSRKTGYRLTRDVYGALGQEIWTWQRVSAGPEKFTKWLKDNLAILKGDDGVLRQFGNHRKYESLKNTGLAVESYVDWIKPPRTHKELFDEIIQANAGNPKESFHILFKSMSGVFTFGRTAVFDYLTMIGKLGLAPIEPGSAYMVGATGPLQGAKLLFANDINADISRSELDHRLISLAVTLKIGMQEIEDSLCNWQKSPANFQRFRG